MRFVDSTMRYVVPSLGLRTRWLRERLAAEGVAVPVSPGCLRELIEDADRTACQLAAESAGDQPYLAHLRREIAARASFVARWTGSDEKLDAEDPQVGPLVQIARKYALPRRWKLSEPVAREYRRSAFHSLPAYWALRGGARAAAPPQ